MGVGVGVGEACALCFLWGDTDVGVGVEGVIG